MSFLWKQEFSKSVLHSAAKQTARNGLDKVSSKWLFLCSDKLFSRTCLTKKGPRLFNLFLTVALEEV